MKIRRVTATPINFPLEAPYGWVFGELPGFSQTIIEGETDEGIAAQREQLEVPSALITLLTRYAEQGSPMARN